jgi:hypothetical protein
MLAAAPATDVRHEQADPVVALEKLLELRFSMHRSAWMQRELVRLRPDLRKPLTADMRAARGTAGTSTGGSMADEMLDLSGTLDDIVF